VAARRGHTAWGLVIALPLSNTFEGGSHGTTISTGNSGGGSGSAFDLMAIGASATLTYDNTQPAHGSLAAKHTTPAGATTSNYDWRNTGSLPNQTDLYGRMYVWLPSAQSAVPIQLFRLFDSTLATEVGRISHDTNNKLTVTDSGLSVGTVTTATFPLDQWVRIEWHYVAGATGSITASMYLADDVAAITNGTATRTSVNMGNNIGRAAMGIANSVANGLLYTDDVALANSAIGPIVTTQILRPSADSVDGNWTNQAGSNVNLYQSIDESIADDADYIQSELAPSGSATRIKLGTGSSPQSGTRTFRWRAAKDPDPGATMTVTPKLFQGGGNTVGAGTLVQTFTAQVLTGTFQTFTETITGTVTDWSQLYIELWATQS
jgi:hypothetical protein